MNKKGFSLIEILVVVTVLAIIIAIAIPNISKAINQNNIEGYKDYELYLVSNLEMYNIDLKEDLWHGNPYVTVSKDELKRVSKDIDFNHKDCQIIGDFKIFNNYPGYDYQVCIKCGDDYKSKHCD